MSRQTGLTILNPPRASSSIAIPDLSSPGSSTSSSTSDDLVTPSTSLSSASPQYQSPLLRNPSEIIHRVLCSSGVQDPVALSRAAKTCKELRSLIYENPNQALWRDIHLDLYDDPRTASAFTKPREKFDWKSRVQQRELVGRMAREWTEDRYSELANHLEMMCETLLDLYLDLPAITPPNDSSFPSSEQEVLNTTLLETILRSPLFAHFYYTLSYRKIQPALRPLANQSASPLRRATRTNIHPGLSRLHCLLPPDFDQGDEIHRVHRGYLREAVYNGGNFTGKNDWGPYTEEGKVDWALVDAVSSVMLANAKDVIALGEDSWRAALQPLSFGIESVRGWGWHDMQRPADLAPGEVWDWAGVEGIWTGSYAFLDYADWLTLNEPGVLAIRRGIQDPPDLTRYSEAVGDLLHMHLTIDRPTCATPDCPVPSDPHPMPDDLPPLLSTVPIGNFLPPIRFRGHSSQSATALPAASNVTSAIRGTVQLTTDDPPQIRWTLVIRYGGEDRWKVEAVQVGGRGSKRGFVGVWTDAAKEQHSPNGPAWYWKS